MNPLDAFFGLQVQAQKAVIAVLLVLLLCVAIAGGGATLYYWADAKSARADAATAAGDLVVERANVKACRTAITNQNAAVDGLAAQSKATLAAAEAALRAATADAAKNRKRADDILAAKPDDPADLCASALTLYRRSTR